METRYISLEDAIDTAKFYEAECDPIPRLIDSLNAIPPAHVVPTPRWIPAKERLPERGCYVLACYKSCFFTEPLPVVKFLRREGEYWVSEAGWRYLQKNITHWMPLPEPPNEEK